MPHEVRVMVPWRSVRSLRSRWRPGPPSSIVGRASKLSSRQRAGSGVEGPDRGVRKPLRGDESDRRGTPARALRVTSRSRGSTARGERRDGRINEYSAAARGGGPPVRPRLRLLPQPGGGVSRAPPPDEGGLRTGRKGLPHRRSRASSRADAPPGGGRHQPGCGSASRSGRDPGLGGCSPPGRTLRQRGDDDPARGDAPRREGRRLRADSGVG